MVTENKHSIYLFDFTCSIAYLTTESYFKIFLRAIFLEEKKPIFIMHFYTTTVAVVAAQAFSVTLASAQEEKAALVPRFALAQASSECDAEE